MDYREHLVSHVWAAFLLATLATGCGWPTISDYQNQFVERVLSLEIGMSQDEFCRQFPPGMQFVSAPAGFAISQDGLIAFSLGWTNPFLVEDVETELGTASIWYYAYSDIDEYSGVKIQSGALESIPFVLYDGILVGIGESAAAYLKWQPEEFLRDVEKSRALQEDLPTIPFRISGVRRQPHASVRR